MPFNLVKYIKKFINIVSPQLNLLVKKLEAKVTTEVSASDLVASLVVIHIKL